MCNKIYIGTVNKTINSKHCYDGKDIYILGERLSIQQHSWDCGWYWGFGYIGNKNLHCHADVFISKLLWCSVADIFSDSIFRTENDLWLFKDLLKQAYGLKAVAEIYRHGGYCCVNDKSLFLKDADKASKINEDLKIVLDNLWDFLLEMKGAKH